MPRHPGLPGNRKYSHLRTRNMGIRDSGFPVFPDKPGMPRANVPERGTTRKSDWTVPWVESVVNPQVNAWPSIALLDHHRVHRVPLCCVPRLVSATPILDLAVCPSIAIRAQGSAGADGTAGTPGAAAGLVVDGIFAASRTDERTAVLSDLGMLTSLSRRSPITDSIPEYRGDRVCYHQSNCGRRRVTACTSVYHPQRRLLNSIHGLIWVIRPTAPIGADSSTYPFPTDPRCLLCSLHRPPGDPVLHGDWEGYSGNCLAHARR